ncbi:MAG: hypothetical protein ABEK10_02725 [Candidatus Nanosalina sp.]
MDLEQGMEETANALLPAVELESYESGNYGSLQEIEKDMSSAWEEYKQDEGLEEFGELDEVFDVNYSGILKDFLTVESADYTVKFGKDLRSTVQKLMGEEQRESYEAGLYQTQHFGLEETIHVQNFFTDFLESNFQQTD